MTSRLVSFGAIWFLLPSTGLAQFSKRRVLFIGNSYTERNDLPLLTARVAASQGDTLLYNSNLIGGATLQEHASDAVSVSQIRTVGWDVLVLQEQSQRPALPLSEVRVNVFPFARQLDSLRRRANPQAETLFYMTWGRKNGDATNCSRWPPVCTYMGMDSLLQLRYLMMADSNRASVSPVGAVWRAIRQTYPGIELYNSDEQHPSLAGSYAAACCFYACLFRKNPALITFDAGLPAADAANIRAVVKRVVFDRLTDWRVSRPNAPALVLSIESVPAQAGAYPNPATDLLTLPDVSPDALWLINSLGQVHWPIWSCNGPQVWVWLTGLAAGSYQLMWQQNGQQRGQRIVKQ